MKKGLQTSILISTGVIAGAGIGIGAFTLWKNINSQSNPIEYTWHVYSNTGLGYKIKEANINGDGDVRFLGDKGLMMLAKMIKDKMNYGPEIFGLKDIVIGDENIIDKDTNGLYFPATNEIFINTYSWRQKGFDLTSDPTNINDINNRVSLLFDIIFHEYGHYLADTYLNSVDYHSKWSAKDIFSKNGNGKDSWDNDFLSKFETLLYSDTKKYTNNTTIKNSKYRSIGGTYTAKDLYTMVNKTNGSSIDSDLKNKNFVFSGPHPEYQLTDKSVIDKKHLEYIYSLPEIFTRKYQQLSMALIPTNEYNGQHITNRGWFMYNNTHSSATNLLSDALNYQKSIINKKRYLGDWVFDGQTIKFKNNTLTQPIHKSRQENLYELMDRHMGHSKGDDISVIWHKNNNKIDLNENGQHIIYGSKANANLIKIGGYTKEAFKYIGFIEKNTFKPLSKILRNKYNFKMKNSLESNERIGLKKQLENTFYTTEKYIYAPSIGKDQLYFAEDINGKNARALKSIREKLDGFATSWRVDQDSSKNNPFRAFNENGKIVIKKATW